MKECLVVEIAEVRPRTCCEGMFSRLDRTSEAYESTLIGLAIEINMLSIQTRVLIVVKHTREILMEWKNEDCFCCEMSVLILMHWAWQQQDNNCARRFEECKTFITIITMVMSAEMV